MPESLGHGLKSPTETRDFASRPESPVTGAEVSGWTQEPEPRRPIAQIEGKDYNKVAKKMIDNH
jgi:hypothetical protein